jgi:hypothetical protein
MSPGDKGDAHAPLELPDWWPEAAGDVRFPTDDSLPAAAKALRGHLDALDMAMNDVHNDGMVTAADVGNWDAGQALAQTVKSAHEQIGAVYRDFQSQLFIAARLLVISGEGHEDAEHVSTRAARRLDDGGPFTAPGTHPTRQNTPSQD